MVTRIRDRGITVVPVEHDIPAMMEVCGYIAMLDQGSKIAHGTPAQIRRGPRVIEAELRTDDDA